MKPKLSSKNEIRVARKNKKKLLGRSDLIFEPKAMKFKMTPQMCLVVNVGDRI